ncbi:hypothetical protein ISS98_22105 [Dyella flagellata]|nr:hypothetical protein [Dyella flagellata]
MHSLRSAPWPPPSVHAW